MGVFARRKHRKIMLRTDMAVEFIKNCKTRKITKTLKRTDVNVDKELSERLNKPQGKYITVETDAVKKCKHDEYARVAREFGLAVKELVEGESCLIAGLGNPNMTADALGKKVADRLMITRHLKGSEKMPSVSCVIPNVLGVTGIESFDIVKGVADRTHPDTVIVIDSLAGAQTNRLAAAFQVSNAGITPGSGVSNHRMRFDRESLGCNVVSVGVPLVVYASTIIEDAVGAGKHDFGNEISSLVVTPKDIDLLVDDCAEIVARAVNFCFFGEE